MIGHILLGFLLGLCVGLVIRLPDVPVDGTPIPPKNRLYLKKGNVRRIK